MAREKYTIFLSSTYDDLKEERRAVERAILKMGHIPVGMEMFPASDSESWDVIQRHIQDSDYYVVIVANRYGSVASDGRSYTEKEYDLAVSLGVPVLGFVIRTDVPRLDSQREATDDGRTKLAAFVSKVQRRQRSTWGSAAELASEVQSALNEAFYTHPRVGWVRRDPEQDRVAPELARLSRENAELTAKLAATDPEQVRERWLENELERLEGITVDVVVLVSGALRPAKTTKLYDLFWMAATHLLQTSDTFAISVAFADAVHQDLPEDVLNPAQAQHAYPILQTLAAMELVDLVPRPPGTFEDARWKLSERGRAVWGAMFRRGVRIRDAADEQAE